jgi:hypothetical protein
LSALHFAPSVAASLLTLYLAYKGAKGHKFLAYGMAGLAILGLIGFITGDLGQLSSLSFHSGHALIGLISLIASLAVFFTRGKDGKSHCFVGRIAGVFALVSLVMGSMILVGVVPGTPTQAAIPIQIPTPSSLPEVEATRFMDTTLTPIKQQGNNAIEGTQFIDRGSYRLTVTGLVEKDLTLAYTDLLKLPAYSELVYMPCVEGWGFYAKWTGFRVSDLLDKAAVSGGDYVVFHCSDGYTTGLPLSYLIDNHTLLAYGLNDVTLPPERGFPLQLVGDGKYGYKWAKWIVEVEVVKGEVRGYWESRGYINSGDVGSFPFGP